MLYIELLISDCVLTLITRAFMCALQLNTTFRLLSLLKFFIHIMYGVRTDIDQYM